MLGLLDARLARGQWLCGEALSAVDVYWAVFANLFAPLPEDELPALPMIRDAYTCRDDDINAALTTRLRAHQRRIYDDYLELPVPLG